MKRISILSAAVFASVGSASADLKVYEPFAYGPGTNLGGQGGWINVNTGDEAIIAAGSLFAVGFPGSSGNMVTFGGAGIDPALLLTPDATTLYFSFLMNVSDLGTLDTTGGYFAGFGSNATTFGTTIWTQSDGAGGYNIGMEKRTAVADVLFDTASFAAGSTVLVVGSYTYNGGSNDDVSNLWINPSPATFGSTEPAPTLSDALGTDLAVTGIERFFLRQDTGPETPAAMSVDELRIGNSYAEVTAIPEPTTFITIVSGIGMLGLLRRRQSS
jgi:hypothetical protein